MKKKLGLILFLIVCVLGTAGLCACTDTDAVPASVDITDAESLYAADKYCATTAEDITLKLTADVNVTDGSYVPLGADAEHPFCGTFDGQGKTVALTVDKLPDSGAVGLFGYIKNATIKNLSIILTVSDKALLGYSASYIGGVAGMAFGENTISNVNVFLDCSAKMSYQSRIDINKKENWYCENYQYVGGIIGSATDNLTITDCTVNSLTVKAYDIVNTQQTYFADLYRDSVFAGGIVGHAAGASTKFSNSKVLAIDANILSGTVYFGGAVGSLERGDLDGVTVAAAKDIVLDSRLKGYAGGFAGYAYESKIANSIFTLTAGNSFTVSTINKNRFSYGGAVGFMDAALHSQTSQLNGCQVTAYAELGNATTLGYLVGSVKNSAVVGNTAAGAIAGREGGAVAGSSLGAYIADGTSYFGTIAGYAYGSTAIRSNNATAVAPLASALCGKIEAYVPVDDDGNSGTPVTPVVA